MRPVAAIWTFALVLVITIVYAEGSVSCKKFILRQSSDNNDGYLTSPGYPETYEPGQCIMWFYYGHEGLRVTVRFIDVGIPTLFDECDNDVLLIGPINQRKYCGDSKLQLFDTYEAQMTKLQSVFYIVFNSTSMGTKGRGFKIYYRFSDGGNATRPATRFPWTTMMKPTTRLPWTTMKTEPELNECYFVQTQSSGVITLDAAHEKMSAAGTCTWVVYSSHTGDGQYFLSFKECHMSFEDRLKVYDGITISDELLGTYYGTICPAYLITTRHGFVVTFSSRDAKNAQLRVEYNTINSGHSDEDIPRTEEPTRKQVMTTLPVPRHVGVCAFTYTDWSGAIKSSDFFYKLDQAGSCSLLLYNSSTEGHMVTYVMDFKVQLYPGSVIWVYDGHNVGGNILTRIPDDQYQTSVTSNGNSVFIQFIRQKDDRRNIESRDSFTITYYMHEHCDSNHEACGNGELGCYHESDRCNNVWDCPLHGGDEKGCSSLCPQDYSCDLTSQLCYTESDRCNGKGTCPNYMDEWQCTPEQCSADKGLFLCDNGRCIYEKWKCDRSNDCKDNSDEVNCPSFASRRVVVAASVGSLACFLLLVIALGCIYKVYHFRVHQLRGGPRHETPFSRQLAEMFHRRAPPPPYNEAMLTSRPYDEAYLELLNQDDSQGNSTAEGSGRDQAQNGDGVPQRERTRRGHHRGSRGCRHGRRHRDVHQNQPSSHPQQSSETNGLIDVGTLPRLTEMLEERALRQNAVLERTISDPPPYSESDPSSAGHAAIAESSSDSDDGSSDGDETWQESSRQERDDDDDSQLITDGESASIQMELISTNHRNQAQSALSSTSSQTRNSRGRMVPEESNTADNAEDSDKDAETASTSLSVDSASDPPVLVDDDEDKIEEQLTVIEEDSDSDCILAENDDDDNDDDDDDTDSDTACLLSNS